ncbi:MAG: hypothetical protein ACRC92_21640 [Peptostreptococcaceae bacterium]
MNFDIFKGIISTIFPTAKLTKFFNAEKQVYEFTFEYLTFKKFFTLSVQELRQYNEEILAYHMRTIIELEFGKFMKSQNNVSSLSENLENPIIEKVEKPVKKKAEKRKKIVDEKVGE